MGHTFMVMIRVRVSVWLCFSVWNLLLFPDGRFSRRELLSGLFLGALFPRGFFHRLVQSHLTLSIAGTWQPAHSHHFAEQAVTRLMMRSLYLLNNGTLNPNNVIYLGSSHIQSGNKV